jgi:hypothetical protein
MDNVDYPSLVCDHRSKLQRSGPGPAPPGRTNPDSPLAENNPFPTWFVEFLDDRQTRKPSEHTMKAYRQDFIAITTLSPMAIRRDST